MENTDKIKDMLMLIEKNNENYHAALNNLADTFNKSLSSNLRASIKLELSRNEPVKTGNNNPIDTLSRLFSRKS